MFCDFYIKEPLNNIIEFKKIGLIFRPLTESEKQEILDMFDKYFFNKKNKSIILKYLNLCSNKDFYKYAASLNTETFNYCHLYKSYLDSGYKLNKRDLKKNLNLIIRIENTEMFSEYIKEENQEYFINQFIRFMLFMKDEFNDDDAILMYIIKKQLKMLIVYI